MSPTNQNLELILEDFEDHEHEDSQRDGQHSVHRGPMQRSKRIRTPRRNSINGMQRRRNKRMDW